mmetsp:Transcript_40900/g.89369  ORF Transcript_40900/g.89369 Transcript_40900/m.89369 type:complete len:305 (+) Transcript_40900:396-1310(+)
MARTPSLPILQLLPEQLAISSRLCPCLMQSLQVLCLCSSLVCGRGTSPEPLGRVVARRVAVELGGLGCRSVKLLHPLLHLTPIPARLSCCLLQGLQLLLFLCPLRISRGRPLPHRRSARARFDAAAPGPARWCAAMRAPTVLSLCPRLRLCGEFPVAAELSCQIWPRGCRRRPTRCPTGLVLVGPSPLAHNKFIQGVTPQPGHINSRRCHNALLVPDPSPITDPHIHLASCGLALRRKERGHAAQDGQGQDLVRARPILRALLEQHRRQAANLLGIPLRRDRLGLSMEDLHEEGRHVVTPEGLL